ncbi:MAG: diguanylate cyclase, partial [Clostridia bacterium]|nr:diguanylate cyclase [Clostridia bacterium]
MLKNEKEQEMQINQILNIVKIASFSFPAIAFLQYFSNYYTYSGYFYKYGLLIIFVLLIILIIYLLSTILKSRHFSYLKKWIDPFIALFIAFLSVMLTGSYESQYKFLFLFVIISSSIECSMKVNLSIAGLSAVIIWGIDLICAPKMEVNTYFESDIVLACAFLIISWTIGYYVDLRKKHIESLKDMVNIDGLTGLYNHRYFYDYLSKQISESKNDGSDLSLLFIDIDNFKCYNDMYGHPKGDEVLRIIAGIMKKTVSSKAFIARYGGEEFTIVFPKTGEALAIKEAEKLRNAVQEYIFEGEENLP